MIYLIDENIKRQKEHGWDESKLSCFSNVMLCINNIESLFKNIESIKNKSLYFKHI